MFVLALQRRERSLAAAATTNNRYPCCVYSLHPTWPFLSSPSRSSPTTLYLYLFLPFARRFVFIFPSLAIFIHPPAAFRRETLLTVKNIRFVAVFSFQMFHKTDTQIFITSFPAFNRLKNLVFGHNQATPSPLSFVYELEKSGQILFVLFSLNGISSFWRCICSIVSVRLLSPPPSFFSILLLS